MRTIHNHELYLTPCGIAVEALLRNADSETDLRHAGAA
jgi:hypothetical protein